ncbi:MAG: hypothetical protein ACI923_002872, partial [Flavobacteriales bacterium]
VCGAGGSIMRHCFAESGYAGVCGEEGVVPLFTIVIFEKT